MKPRIKRECGVLPKVESVTKMNNKPPFSAAVSNITKQDITLGPYVKQSLAFGLIIIIIIIIRFIPSFDFVQCKRMRTIETRVLLRLHP